MTTTTHLTPAELDALLEAARATVAQDGKQLRLAEIAFTTLANPTTITRLVLMMRELQQERDDAREMVTMEVQRIAAVETERNRFSELADKRHDELSKARRQRDSLAAKFNEYSRDVVEHFRARAVRVITEQAQDWEKRSDFGKLSGYVNRSAAAFHLAKTIESLPLVETEEK